MRTIMLVCVVTVVVLVTFCSAQSSTTTTAPKTTTSPIAATCGRNLNCSSCASNPKCLWCETNPVVKCIVYPASQIIPHKDVCDLAHARWGVCWVNYKALLITMGVVAGVLLISLMCCIYCCCCRRKGGRARYAREEAQLERERDERRNKHAERRAERQGKMDDIRQKYGLGGGNVNVEPNQGLSRDKNDSHYKRFENEA